MNVGRRRRQLLYRRLGAGGRVRGRAAGLDTRRRCACLLCRPRSSVLVLYSCTVDSASLSRTRRWRCVFSSRHATLKLRGGASNPILRLPACLLQPLPANSIRWLAGDCVGAASAASSWVAWPPRRSCFRSLRLVVLDSRSDSESACGERESASVIVTSQL